MLKRISSLALTVVFAGVMLLVIGGILVWNTQQRINDLHKTEQQLMKSSVLSGANQISFIVTDLRRQVGVFVDDYIDDILMLARIGRVGSVADNVEDAINRHFPTSYTYTVTDRSGNLLVDDYSGLIGRMCRADIDRFSREEHFEEVYVHPSTLGYHFDIMVEWVDPANPKHKGVFFVSFLLEDISRVLENSALPGHQLVLRKRGVPNEIKVSIAGGRMSGNPTLSPDELANISVTKLVPGSLWEIVDIPPYNLYAEQERRYWIDAIVSFVILVVVIATLLLFLARKQRQLTNSQTQLMHSDKMASLGQMVAGLVHEVNTPLAYIRANLELLGGRLPQFSALLENAYKIISGDADASVKKEFKRSVKKLSDSSVVVDLENVTKDSIDGIDEISHLVLNLKDFSRVEGKFKNNVFVEEALKHAVSIAKHKMNDMTVHEHFSETPSINAMPSQLNQLFLNLLNNAIDAVDGKDGEITLRSGVSGSYVTAEIEDNGAGMSSSIRKKMFDPFYTTKAVGKGTGLGLSIVNKIIESHEGKIEVISKQGKGTRIVVSLPVRER